MARGRDRSDRRLPREEGEDRARTDAEAAAETRPQAELRWVQIPNPREAVELGRNGRVVDSRFHAGYDSWEVLLETYEGELSR
ncbi:hypothetical protein [Halorussus sp. MSC15.2]|uniref:hypothetical protein n=1 Tax=Halorussus sp. MSC15.2 TaxID=2283638 RepID=UPI0013D0CA39|nr:hypothetical protein [Halorussus sp. MSC15.2]NEU56141.1 hypothetical protein [Halorussus sp. MSC15.2]